LPVLVTSAPHGRLALLRIHRGVIHPLTLHYGARKANLTAVNCVPKDS
jgi:hypothetical protein